MAVKDSGYGIVYRSVMRDKRLSMESKSIYAYLCSFADTDGRCYPSVELMMRELNCGNNRFYRHLKPLLDYGYISKSYQRNGNRWANTIYKVISPAQCPQHKATHTQNSDTHNQYNDTVCVTHDDTTNRETVQNDDTKKPRIKTNSLNNPNDQQICEFTNHICKILNRAKARVCSKGRLKPNEYTIRNLLNAGCSFEQIEVVAICFVTDNKDASWLDLERACKKQYNLRLNL